MDIDNINEMNAHFLSCYPNEGCGVVVNNTFKPCDNVFENPENNFRIRRGDYLKHEKAGGVEAVMHSHTHQDNQHDVRSPSETDMTYQKATAVPWGLVACDGEHVNRPLWFGLKDLPAIEGRFYVPNAQDCLTLCVDYMKMEFNIDLPIFPRPIDWQRSNKNMITDGIDVSGFKRLSRSTPLDELQHGDWLLLAVQSNYVNHCGIIAEDGMFWHQLENRFSKKDHIMKWEKQIKMFLRHKDLEE